MSFDFFERGVLFKYKNNESSNCTKIYRGRGLNFKDLIIIYLT